MKSLKRIVNTGFWNDDLVLRLTPEDKYFMLYLLTNPFTTQLGIYHLPIKTCAYEMGYSEEAVIGLIDRFENKYGLIKYSKATNEVAIKNYLRHSIAKGGKPVYDCLVKEEEGVKDKELLLFVLENLTKYIDTNINETIKEYIGYLNTLYSNDNERIVNDSGSSASNPSKSNKVRKFKKPTVDEVAAYCQQRNNKVNPEAFIAFYDSNGWKVGKNPMQNWKAAVITWEQKDKDKERLKGIKQTPNRKYMDNKNEDDLSDLFQ